MITRVNPCRCEAKIDNRIVSNTIINLIINYTPSYFLVYVVGSRPLPASGSSCLTCYHYTSSSLSLLAGSTENFCSVFDSFSSAQTDKTFLLQQNLSCNSTITLFIQFTLKNTTSNIYVGSIITELKIRFTNQKFITCSQFQVTQDKAIYTMGSAHR